MGLDDFSRGAGAVQAMRKVGVELGPRSYSILIAPELCKQTGRLFLEHSIGKRIFVVSNNRVFSLHGARVRHSLQEAGFKVTEIFVPDGEEHKNLHTVERIYTYLAAQRAERESTIVALGGGVTGDMGGFVAATFLRGIDCVQMPTTLLAQVDSSVGGKTGVNHQKGKNLVGAFHQPRLVLIDTATLSTLPEREFQSGVFEVVKYGLIYDSSFFSFLESELDDLLARKEETLEQVIARCCEIKAEVTSQDERESDLRRILNFGHTFGHALEVTTAYLRLAHGEAVAFGMLAATELSRELGLLDSRAADRVARMIRRVGPLPPVDDIGVQELLEAMEHDKKRQEDVVHFVLLDRIGHTEIRGGLEEALLAQVWTTVQAAEQQLSHG